MNTGLNPFCDSFIALDHRVGDVVVGVRPGVDDLVVALAVRDVAGLVRALEALDALRRLFEQRLLLRGISRSSMPIETPPRVALRKPNSFSRSRNCTVPRGPLRAIRTRTPARRAPSSSCRGSGSRAPAGRSR